MKYPTCLGSPSLVDTTCRECAVWARCLTRFNEGSPIKLLPTPRPVAEAVSVIDAEPVLTIKQDDPAVWVEIHRALGDVGLRCASETGRSLWVYDYGTRAYEIVEVTRADVREIDVVVLLASVPILRGYTGLKRIKGTNKWRWNLAPDEIDVLAKLVRNVVLKLVLPQS